jgi:hypothetical protein
MLKDSQPHVVVLLLLRTLAIVFAAACGCSSPLRTLEIVFVTVCGCSSPLKNFGDCICNRMWLFFSS